jgi:hypothetical protein
MWHNSRNNHEELFSFLALRADEIFQEVAEYYSPQRGTPLAGVVAND